MLTREENVRVAQGGATTSAEEGAPTRAESLAVGRRTLCRGRGEGGESGEREEGLLGWVGEGKDVEFLRVTRPGQA